MLTRLIGVALLLSISSMSPVQAKQPHLPSQKSIEQGIDQRINALRSDFVSRSEFDVVNNLEADIKKLIDEGQKRDAQLNNLADMIGRTLVNFPAEIDKLSNLPDIDTTASKSITNGLGGIQGSLSPRFLSFPSIGTLMWTILGALFGAGSAGLFAIYVAEYYTKNMKMFEATLEFSKRFGELIKERTELNNKYAEGRCSSPRETNEAKTWWTRFFDLMVYEYDFFREGYLWSERFAEWMRWRWYDHNAKGDNIWKTCGMDYKEGWEMWKKQPANCNNRLKDFLDEIHHLKNADAVEEHVMKLAPKPGWVRTVIRFLAHATKYGLVQQKTVLGAPGKTIKRSWLGPE